MRERRCTVRREYHRAPVAGPFETEPPLEGERILVTGAGGFIGRHLVAELAARGAAVTATCRRPGQADSLSRHADLRAVDLTRPGLVRELIDEVRPDRVLNLARGRGDADTEARRRLVAETLGVVTELVECASEAGCRQLVQLGSPTEYGPSSEPLDESLPPAPVTTLGAAKAAATLFCLAAHRAGRIRATVLRPFVVYGPGDRPTRLIPRAIEAAISGAALPLTRETVRRDWVHVDDVVRGCILALDGRADGEVVNLASGRDHDNETVVRLVAEATGRRIEIAAEPEPERPWDAPRWHGTTEKAEAVLGWRAAITLEAGIARTVAERMAAAR